MATGPTTRAPMILPQTLAPPPDVSAPTPAHLQIPPVHFYKCSTGTNSDGVSHDVSERSKERASLNSLQKAYNELNSRKIKDPLSSFLPDIPGDFDSAEPSGTMLLDLVEHKPIGGKEFHTLSGQALLGFRLLPGPLPEQFRIDPPSLATQSKSRKKKKHKHKTIDRSEDKSDPFRVAPKLSKPPSDAYSFIKHEPHYVMPGAETVLHVGGGVVGGGVVSGGGGAVSAAQILQQQQVYGSSSGAAHLVGGMPPIQKKKKKRDKDKKKKDKKKRRHHTPQDPTTHPSHPPSHPPHIHTPPPPPSTHFSHP